MPEMIIKTVIGYGAFDEVSQIETSKMLSIFATSLPAFAINKILFSSFFANEDTKTPMMVSCIGVIVNVILSLSLIQYYQHLGLAIGTSVSTWIITFTLFVILRKRDMFTMDERLAKKSSKIMLATSTTIFILVIIEPFVRPFFNQIYIMRIIALVTFLLIGKGTYLAAIYFIGNYKISDIKNIMNDKEVNNSDKVEPS